MYRNIRKNTHGDNLGQKPPNGETLSLVAPMSVNVWCTAASPAIPLLSLCAWLLLYKLSNDKTFLLVAKI